jgi:hypothetical protein
LRIAEKITRVIEAESELGNLAQQSILKHTVLNTIDPHANRFGDEGIGEFAILQRNHPAIVIARDAPDLD